VKKAKSKKTTKKSPRPVGRPPKVIDWKIVENLCIQHHTQAEIAAIMGTDINTLKARCLDDNGIYFSQFYKTYLKVGKSSIRKKLWEEAMNGNTQVLMHQAKHVLAQWDKQQIEVTTKPYIIEAPDGKEAIRLGVEHYDQIEGETIDVEAIEQSEQNRYDEDQSDEGLEDESTTHESNEPG